MLTVDFRYFLMRDERITECVSTTYHARATGERIKNHLTISHFRRDRVWCRRGTPVANRRSAGGMDSERVDVRVAATREPASSGGVFS